jgi:hypothetical protein
MRWTWAKRRLAFCELTQDGDAEGVFRLQRLPTASEAEEIRYVLGKCCGRQRAQQSQRS